MLLDDAVDVKRAEDGCGPFVVDDYKTIAAWRDEGAVVRRNRIFVTARCSHHKWDKWNPLQPFSNLVNHDKRLDQKLSLSHYLLAVKPDIKIAADTIDMRLGSPICAGVLGVGMTKRDVDSGNFFVL